MKLTGAQAAETATAPPRRSRSFGQALTAALSVNTVVVPRRTAMHANGESTVQPAGPERGWIAARSRCAWLESATSISIGRSAVIAFMTRVTTWKASASESAISKASIICVEKASRSASARSWLSMSLMFSAMLLSDTASAPTSSSLPTSARAERCPPAMDRATSPTRRSERRIDVESRNTSVHNAALVVSAVPASQALAACVAASARSLAETMWRASAAVWRSIAVLSVSALAENAAYGALAACGESMMLRTASCADSR